MLRHFKKGYVMFCYVMLCFVMLCCVTSVVVPKKTVRLFILPVGNHNVNYTNGPSGG